MLIACESLTLKLNCGPSLQETAKLNLTGRRLLRRSLRNTQLSTIVSVSSETTSHSVKINIIASLCGTVDIKLCLMSTE